MSSLLNVGGGDHLLVDNLGSRLLLDLPVVSTGGYFSPYYFSPFYFTQTYFTPFSFVPPPDTVPNEDILSSVTFSILQAVSAVSGLNLNTSLVTLFPEPFPIAGSPLCLITPGEFSELEGQNTGGGRYVSGFRGILFTHLIVRNYEDIVLQDQQFMINAADGVYPLVDRVVNALQFEFLEDSTTNKNIITQEPIRLVEQTQLVKYDRAGSWGGVRLAWETSVSLILTEPDFLVVNPTAIIGSSLTTIIPAYQSLIVSVVNSSQIFNINQCIIGLENEPFPINGSPFCMVTPGDFVSAESESSHKQWNRGLSGFGDIEGQGTGGGRYVSGFNTQFTIHVIMRNWQDIVLQDYYFLMINNPEIGIFAKVAQLYDLLHMNFIVDGSGNMVTEEPIRLVRIGQPRRYGKSDGWGGIPLVFETKFRYDLTVP